MEDQQPQAISIVNIAESLPKEDLEKIGQDCKEGYELDLRSRANWEKSLDEWTKLAMQVREQKSFPWANASNVKYPLLSTASMQFNARAYPSLIPSDGKVVKGKVIGKDPDGSKSDKADRVATYMSYQFMHEMETWDEEMDKLLMMLPIVGTLFKKTYWCAEKKQVESCLVLPKNLVVNNWAKSVETAERVSEIIEMSQRLFEERKRQKVFLDIDLGTPVVQNHNEYRSTITNSQVIPSTDETTPYILIEQHCYLDLDDDGYKEPYVVTFYQENGTVLRIVPRYEPDDVKQDENGKIESIKPIDYYTKFSFVPNPDGSFYDIGFGILLGPINEAVNTLINQMVDTGTLYNLNSGFIGKGLQLRQGEQRFQLGEWKNVNAMGDDLRKQILPLPVKEPSKVLYELMGALITSGKELASVAEIFVGKMPGQNTPATTTMATIEQGMKVFTAVYKRIYRSLDKEFKKVYKLNAVYLNPETYIDVLDVPVGPKDFDTSNYDVCPGADPTSVSQTEKLLKAQGLMELLPTGMLDPVEVVSRVLQAQEQPNWQKLFNQQVQQTGQFQPPSDPKQQEMEMKSQIEQMKVQQKAEYDRFKAELEARSQQQKMQMEAQMADQEMQHKEAMAKLDAGIQIHKQRIFEVQTQQKHQQGMQQSAESHQQNMQLNKEKASLQAKTSKAGSKAK